MIRASRRLSVFSMLAGVAPQVVAMAGEHVELAVDGPALTGMSKSLADHRRLGVHQFRREPVDLTVDQVPVLALGHDRPRRVQRREGLHQLRCRA